MEWKEILTHVDHTLLKPEATWEDIRQVVEEGIHYGCASVCIPPAYVQRAAEYAAGRVAICTVIGFPNGYNAARHQVRRRPPTPCCPARRKSTWW